MNTLFVIIWESIRVIPRIVPFDWGFVAAPVLYVVSAAAQPFTPPAQFVSTTSEVLVVSRENLTIQPTNRATEVINGPPPVPIDIPFVTGATPATFILKYLAFDPVPGATGYRIYVTPVGAGRAIEVSTNFVTSYTTNAISNMLYGTMYWIQAQTLANGTQSDLSMPFQWPQPLVSVSTVRSFKSSDMVTWTHYGTDEVLTNNGPAEFHRLSISITNNIDVFQVRQ